MTLATSCNLRLSKYKSKLCYIYYSDYSQRRIYRTPPSLSPTEMAIYAWKIPTVLKRLKNQFSNFYFLSYGWLYLQFTGDTPWLPSLSPTKKKSFISGQIYMKNAQCPETNEKINFQFFTTFSFWDILKFRRKFFYFWHFLIMSEPSYESTNRPYLKN